MLHLKYVDDLTLAEGVDMNKLTYRTAEERQQPDAFRSRTGHELRQSESRLLSEIDRVHDYATVNGMRINVDKTKFMMFNPCTSKDFLPSKTLDGAEIELVESTKLLGINLNSSLSWDDNTKLINKKCFEKMWMLKRLKKLGANQEDLLQVYLKQIRCLAEYAVPVWSSSLTGVNSAKIERIQKSATRIILGDAYTSYSRALETLGIQRLANRRKLLCLKFALKCEKDPKFSKWFKLNTKNRNTRQKPTKYCEVYSHTERFYRSPIAYLTRLLNEYYLKK